MSTKNSKHIWMKLFSILGAIVLWLYVINVQNPETEKDLKNIPVQYINVSDLEKTKLVLLNDDDQTVSVRVKGHIKTLQNIRSDSIVAKIDVKGIKQTGKVVVPVTIDNMGNELIVTRKNPENITMSVDKYAEIQKEITLENATLKDSYMLSEVQIMPKTVTINGPLSILKTIQKASITVPWNEKMEKVSSNSFVELWNDTDRLNDTHIRITPEVVKVDGKVYTKKQVPIEIQTSGKPKNNKSVAKLDAMIQSVLIKGAVNTIQGIDRIKTEPINLDAIGDSTTTSVKLMPTDGVFTEQKDQRIDVKVTLNE